MRTKLSVLMIIFLLTVTILTGCGTSSNVKNSEAIANEDRTFKVGLEAGYAPFNWTQMDDSNGGVKIDGAKEFAGGYDVEIAKKIAEGLGKELVIIKTEWDGLVPALTSGKIDAIIAGMSPTDERKEAIDFTDNYYKSNLVMVVKKGGKYENATSIQDFKGAKITGQLNTFHYSVIDQIKDVDKQTAMDNFTAIRVALESGIIDGYVSERPEGISAETANQNFKMIEFKDGFNTSDDDTAIAVGVAKGSDLTEKINKILKGITEEEQTAIMDTVIKNQPSAE
ncbi:transporter substrate-binding domain-containing protein [Tissierella praeacuta]|uniref:Amino acid ABC transporter substrate-binding protein, PAAT family n=1 Tax=Tissierella praeacuta DSM 18095 TaxID=1123404 RepID=A0A1M4YWB9_9FIRM|nr:transporter substrate-binding domain-containing protein [Tissierella praeacuta]SHF09998.1 amino acid ABC transporter substrate-binding protein, PAAT family [Tissierella praeacuta DSM 18095]SUP00699.1 Arginine-binding extracellular protein ArtP precursor [Tissierella praeacuta]HAE92277.1 ABC transporter substrate-binding protein [Tissierella sp.]